MFLDDLACSEGFSALLRFHPPRAALGPRRALFRTEADNWTPIMARPLGPEIYMMLLEKGVAKLLGGSAHSRPSHRCTVRPCCGLRDVAGSSEPPPVPALRSIPRQPLRPRYTKCHFERCQLPIWIFEF